MQEAGEGTESLTRISLAISILAVLVAMVTVLGHHSHTQAVLEQSRANDTWNQYESKKIRADNFAVTIDLLTLQPNLNAEAVAKKLADYKSHLDKETHDLADLQQSALEKEAEVAHVESEADRFDLGEALLQIAVVLASITLLTRRRGYFFFGLTLGIVGLITAASAFLIH